jgi:Fe-S cluster assembly iron-binding protein IscA
MFFLLRPRFTQPVENGSFVCPGCQQPTQFVFSRVWSFWIFFPFTKRLEREFVACSGCRAEWPVTVLRNQASQIPAESEIAGSGAPRLCDSIGQLVQLTPDALDEVFRRHEVGNFDSDVAVRLTPVGNTAGEVQLTFDLPLVDGEDWLGDSGGVPILIDRRAAAELKGATIDFRNGQFVRV